MANSMERLKRCFELIICASVSRRDAIACRGELFRAQIASFRANTGVEGLALSSNRGTTGERNVAVVLFGA